MAVRVALALVTLAFGAAVGGALAAGDRKAYLRDFDFIDETVRSRAAAIESKKVDWKRHAARLRKQFAECTSDEEHLRNCMELIAGLRDSHSDVTRVHVADVDLPGKFDGLYGAALDFAWDDGKFVLRSVKEGHAQAGQLAEGSVLVGVGGEPAWLAFARDRARIERWFGISSLHSLYGSLSNRLLPFGDAQQLELTFLEPGGDVSAVTVARWGPGGKAHYPFDVEVPEGIEHADGAVSTTLKTKWSPKVGYLRITGGMNRETCDAFHAALDALAGMEALVLDCRGMGGGGDASAWEMAGRFFPDGVDNGRNGRIEASGAAQFDGPVVLLQNETMVSSAETFAWAMTETDRAVSVGRPTGGWGIIPNVVSCPSGMLDLRIGVNDRPTPIRGV
ncbi:MAG: S41 family peptidase, partial [Planctomycetota bacterium JB042]